MVSRLKTAVFTLLFLSLSTTLGAFWLNKLDINVPFLKGKPVVLSHIFKNNIHPEIVFFALHDNENTSIAAAKSVVSDRGGRIFRINNNEQRLLKFHSSRRRYKIDPNRIFTPRGVRSNIRYYNKKYSKWADIKVSRMARRILKQYPLKEAWVVVGLHNNTDRRYSVISYKKGYRLGRNALLTYYNPGRDKDDFFLVTKRRFYNYFKSRGFNVVYQNNRRVIDDGSLAVYCARFGIPYINVEAQYGHAEQQKEMIRAIYEMYDRELAKRREKDELRILIADKKMRVRINGFKKEYPIATGERYGQKLYRHDLRTPIGSYKIEKIHDARKWNFGRIPRAYGRWFIRLGTGWKGIGIHGTSEEGSIGQAISHGCIRMYNNDINELIRHVYKGLKVVILP